MRDIVLAQVGQEEAFIERAIALGYDELCLIYEKKPKQALISEKINITTGLVEKSGFGECLVLGTKKTSLLKSATLLANNEFDEQADFVHHRRSGLNHVLLAQCKEKKVVILFTFADLQGKEVGVVQTILGRMSQNAKLCTKLGVQFELVSLASRPQQMRFSKDVRAMKQTLFS